MKALFGLLTATSLLGLAQAQTAYVDVPACHWAVQAIRIVSSGDKVTPAQSASNAQNAVRQVFEGLVCGDAAWTTQFIVGAPVGLDAQIKAKSLRSFTLTFGRTVVSGNTASVPVNISLNLASGVERRNAVLTLSSDAKVAWKVNYNALSALNLTVFPK